MCISMSTFGFVGWVKCEWDLLSKHIPVVSPQLSVKGQTKSCTILISDTPSTRGIFFWPLAPRLLYEQRKLSLICWLVNMTYVITYHQYKKSIWLWIKYDDKCLRVICREKQSLKSWNKNYCIKLINFNLKLIFVV